MDTDKIANLKVVGEGERHLDEAQKMTKIGSWNYDLLTNKLTWSDTLYHLFGTDKDGFQNTHDSFLEFIDEADRKRVEQVSKQAQETGEPFHVIYNITTPKGERRKIEEFGYAERNEAGATIRLYGLAKDVTQRVRDEEQLKLGDRVFNNTQDMLCMAGFDGYFKLLNPSWSRVLGWSTEEMLSKPWSEFVHPDDLNNTGSVTSRLQDGKEVFFFENRYLCKDGSYKWLSWNSVPYPDEQVMFGSARDVTDQKKAEESFRKTSELLTKIAEEVDGTFYQFKMDLNGKSSMPFASSKISEIFEVTPDQVREDASLAFSRIHPDDYSRVAKSITDSYESLTLWEDEYRLVLPIAGEIWVNGNAMPEKLKDGSVLWHGYIRDVTRRKKAELDLIAREQELRNLLNSQTTYVLKTDLVGNHIYWNHKFEEEYGWIYQETGLFHGNALLSICDYHHDATNETVRKCMSSPNQIFKIELDKPTKEGGVRTTIWEFICLTDSNGEPIEIQCMGIDISDRKRTEQALIESELKFRNIFEEHNAVKLVVDPLTERIIDANSVAALFYGWSIEELKKMKISEINRLLSKEKVRQVIELATTNKKNTFEFQHTKKNGEVVDVEVWTSPITLDGKKVLHNIIHDISDKKIAEKRIKLLNAAVEQSPVSIVITKADGSIEYVNPYFCVLTGYTFSESIGENPRILKSGHQSQSFYEAMWSDLVAGKNWQGKLVNKKKNGELYWEWAQISPIKDQEGTITHFVAVKQDITEKILAEETKLTAVYEATDAERARIAMEIHDGLQQTLIAAKMGLEAVKAEAAEVSEKLHKRFNFSLDLLNQCILDARGLAHSIMPKNIMEHGFIASTAHMLGLIDTKIQVEFLHDNIEIGDDKIAVNLYRIVQEATNNILKHAKATSVKVALLNSGGKTELTISDNGIGFDTKGDTVNRGLGMNIMKSRAASIGGDFHVLSKPNKGTSITITFNNNISI